MSVYVDDMFQHPSWGKWTGGGHMTADTLDELHAMADRLGLRREWFQSKPGRPWLDHYDLTRSKRLLAITYGADTDDLHASAARMLKRRPALRGVTG